MTEPNGSDGGGWTPGRVIGLIIGLIGMGGFGFCSLCGLAISGGTWEGLGMVGIFVAAGLGLTFLFFLLVRGMVRAARRPPPPPPSSPTAS